MEHKVKAVKSDFISHTIKFEEPKYYELFLENVKLKRTRYGHSMTFTDDGQCFTDIVDLIATLEQDIKSEFENNVIQEFKGHKFFYVRKTPKTLLTESIDSKDHVYYCNVVIRPNIIMKVGSKRWHLGLDLQKVEVHSVVKKAIYKE